MEQKKIRIYLFLLLVMSVATGQAENLYPPELLNIAGGTAPVMLPEDRELGKLNDTGTVEGHEATLLRESRSFFESIADKSMKTNLLDPDLRNDLVLSLENRTRNMPEVEELRYGKIELVGEPMRDRFRSYARVHVRMMTVGEDAVGEILFLWKEGRWYIEELVMNIPRNTDILNNDSGEIGNP